MTSRQPNLMILLGGFFTSGVALVLVALVNLLGFNVMWLHFWFILPLGAILVGMLAGCGYAIASRLFNVKVRSDFIVILVITGIVTYVLSHFITYVFMLYQAQYSFTDYPFLDYVRGQAEHTTFKSGRSNSRDIELGNWGYVLMLIQWVGFTGGYLVPALIVGNRPYCEQCQLYMPKVTSIHHRSELGKKDLKAARGKKEKKEVLTRAVEDALLQFNTWWQLAQPQLWPQIEERLDHWEAVKPGDALATVKTDFYVCDSCDLWHVIATLNNATLGGQPNVKQIHDSRKVPTAPPEPPPYQMPPDDSEGIRDLN